ncbi:hypothetical protein QTP86_033337, partial [Hemibagrus guttatus]
PSRIHIGNDVFTDEPLRSKIIALCAGKMSAPMEVVVTADSAGQLWNCAIFDPHTGTNLLSYRGGNSSARSLTILNGEYILGAQLGKNFINVWEIQRKDQLQQKIVCPGIVTCLTASPDGLYVLAGIAEAIYLWEVSTGNLLVILNRHYQDLSCLRFTDDGSHFVSGGKDNLALVWNLASIVQLDSSRTPEPRHMLSRHSLPITDVHCGLMGPQARVATASLDQTVKRNGKEKGKGMGKKGKRNGKEKGKRNGKEKGKRNRNGKEKGKMNGKEKGKRNGKEKGKRNGKEKGKRNGKEKGKRNGKRNGKEKGKWKGREERMEGRYDGMDGINGIPIQTCVKSMPRNAEALLVACFVVVLFLQLRVKGLAQGPSSSSLVDLGFKLSAFGSVDLPLSYPNLWEISSGEMLLSVLFDVSIMSVTLDPCEFFLFCGGSDGNIFQVSLCNTAVSRDKTFQSDGEGNQVFKGHRNLVTCLSVSMDGTLLLSGSHDETVRMWDVQSKQCIRCINHKGQVTNAAIIPAPGNMFLPDSRPGIPLPRFSRHLNNSEQAEGTGTGGMCLRLGASCQEIEETYLEKADRLNSLMCAVTDKSVFGDGENTKVRVSELEEEVRTLKKINKDLYEFSTQLLTKPN